MGDSAGSYVAAELPSFSSGFTYVGNEQREGMKDASRNEPSETEDDQKECARQAEEQQQKGDNPVEDEKYSNVDEREREMDAREKELKRREMELFKREQELQRRERIFAEQTLEKSKSDDSELLRNDIENLNISSKDLQKNEQSCLQSNTPKRFILLFNCLIWLDLTWLIWKILLNC